MCGLQDAFNLAWKLALVHQGAAHETLLDSYEIERRPVAELVTKSGDVSEHTLTMADPTECKSRNLAIKATIADPKTLHHEIVAKTELNVDYAHSPIVFGDANSSLADIACPTMFRFACPKQVLPGFTRLASARAVL